MKLVNLKVASELTGVTEKTIRNWIDENKIKKYEDDSGKILVDKRAFLLQLPTVLTVFNQKGGVGKTSLSVLLGDYYEKKDQKILLVDFDQQGNLSQTYFGYDELKDSPSLYDYFENKTPISKIVKKYNENIDILPANIKLSRKDNYDIDDLDMMKKDFIPIFKKYNIVIIDCPPALNSFSKFGLMFANYVSIPVMPEPYSYDGLFEVLETINRLKKYIESFIDYFAIISIHEQRILKVQEIYVTEIKKELGDKLLENSIPNFVGIKERGFQKQNIFDFYSKQDKSVSRIESVLDEIDNIIFNKRGE